MENELILLKDIKDALWILIYLIGIGVLLNIIRTIATSYKTIKDELENTFYNTVSPLYENGEYDKVIECSLEHVEKKSKDAYGYWFLGKAYYKKEDYQESLDYFNKTSEICPSWDKEWVEPYIKKINEKLVTSNESKL